MMKRVEKFKQVRRTKRRLLIIPLLFFIVIALGLCIADYSVNSLMKDERQVEIVSVQNIENSYIKINVLNSKFYVNIKYLNRDYSRFKESISRILQFR